MTRQGKTRQGKTRHASTYLGPRKRTRKRTPCHVSLSLYCVFLYTKTKTLHRVYTRACAARTQCHTNTQKGKTRTQTISINTLYYQFAICIRISSPPRRYELFTTPIIRRLRPVKTIRDPDTKCFFAIPTQDPKSIPVIRKWLLALVTPNPKPSSRSRLLHLRVRFAACSRVSFKLLLD